MHACTLPPPPPPPPVGVISRKDIIEVRQMGGSLQDKVKAHMTSPAITITLDTPVKDAGAIMLKEKIRRLPVVDAEGKPLGWVLLGGCRVGGCCTRVGPVGRGCGCGGWWCRWLSQGVEKRHSGGCLKQQQLRQQLGIPYLQASAAGL